MVNNPLIRPYFLGGGGIGMLGPLDSHDFFQLARVKTGRRACSSKRRSEYFSRSGILHLRRQVAVGKKPFGVSLGKLV